MAKRKIIAALQVSLDGLIEGPNKEVDWIENWDDPFDVVPEVDTFILGGGMYPGYEEYWLSILSDPSGILPLTGRPPSQEEVAYAQFADQTPHVVLSRTLERVNWGAARIARDIEEVRQLKQEPGKNIHAVGGAMLVSSLLNEGLLDEVRVTVHPLILGKGTALFKNVHDRHGLKLVKSRPLPGGRITLRYEVLSRESAA